MPNFPDWIKNTQFECDVTKEQFKYTDLYVAWYDRSVKKDAATILYQDKFMLAKQGEGLKRLQTQTDNGWSLSTRSLKKILEENVVLFFTDLLVVDSIHDKGNFEKVTNLKSWTELLRRLTISNYEEARHNLKEAKQIDEFSELTEFQLLQPETLQRFIKSLN